MDALDCRVSSEFSGVCYTFKELPRKDEGGPLKSIKYA